MKIATKPLEVVVEELKGNPELLSHLDDCCTNPYLEPERPKAHVGEMAKLGLGHCQINVPQCYDQAYK